MVEGLVGELVETLFEVALDDVDAVADGGEDVGVVDLDALALDAARLDQVAQQGAVAAAKIEHAVARLDPGGDKVEIGAAQGVRHSLMFRR